MAGPKGTMHGWRDSFEGALPAAPAWPKKDSLPTQPPVSTPAGSLAWPSPLIGPRGVGSPGQTQQGDTGMNHL